MEATMDVRGALEYIHNVKWRGSRLGLGRTRELLASLGNPEKSLKFVHIAGTNGKGSTAAFIAAVLQKAGYRTGLYTSPYIRCFNERMQVDGACITDAELVCLTDEIRPFADAMTDPPTEFEIITALAMQFFRDRKCDIVVLETGLGGELDSTNVIGTPEVAVITAIGYDHVKELGPTLEDIVMAKAGIIKSGGDVVIYGGEQAVEAVFKQVSQQRGARLRFTDFARITRSEISLEGAEFDFYPYGRLSIPLAGTYQPKNAAVAISALEVLRERGYTISGRDIAAGLSSVRWPGRFEVLGRDPVFVLDGAHNPQGAGAAVDSLRGLFGNRKVVFLVGVSADKDVDAILQCIAPLAEAFIAVRSDNPRSLGEDELAAKLSRYCADVSAYDKIADGVTAAIDKAGGGGVVCALGTLFMSADVRLAYASIRDSQGGLDA